MYNRNRRTMTTQNKNNERNIQKGYDPTKYYIDVENNPFCLDCQRRHNVNQKKLL